MRKHSKGTKENRVCCPFQDQRLMYMCINAVSSIDPEFRSVIFSLLFDFSAVRQERMTLRGCDTNPWETFPWLPIGRVHLTT